MEREKCILTNYPVTPHLFRCLILTGNLSREVSPPSDYSAVSHPSLPVSRAYPVTRTASVHGSSVRRSTVRAPPNAPDGPQSRPEPGTLNLARVRAPNTPTAILGRSRDVGAGGHRMSAARTNSRAFRGRSGTFRHVHDRAFPYPVMPRNGRALNRTFRVDLEAH